MAIWNYFLRILTSAILLLLNGLKERVLKDKVEEACRCELGAQQVKQPQGPVEANWEILCNEAEPRSRLEVWCRWSSRCSAGHKQDFGGRVG